MTSTCFEAEGSSSGRRFGTKHTLRLQDCLYRWHVNNYTTPVRTTVFLKMNPRVQNM